MKKDSKFELIIAFLIALVFATVGVLVFYFTGGYDAIILHDFKNYLLKHLIEFLFSIVFIGTGIYLVIYLYNDEIKQPTEKLLYLNRQEDNLYYFIDKKGKKYVYYNSDENYRIQIGKYYKAFTSGKKVKEVIMRSEKNFPLTYEKENYWLNFYTPIGNFNEILLLPLVYIASIPGVASFIIAKGLKKIPGIIFAIIPIFLIVYDSIYKYIIRKKKIKLMNINNPDLANEIITKDNSLDIMKNVSINLMDIIRNLIIIIAMIAFTFFAFYLYKRINENDKIFLIPFIVVGIAISIKYIIPIVKDIIEIIKIFNNTK